MESVNDDCQFPSGEPSASFRIHKTKTYTYQKVLSLHLPLYDIISNIVVLTAHKIHVSVFPRYDTVKLQALTQ